MVQCKCAQAIVCPFALQGDVVCYATSIFSIDLRYYLPLLAFWFAQMLICATVADNKGSSMPTITDIQIQKRNKQRANLYLDGQFAFGVEMLVVMQLGLKIGAEVSQEKINQAVLDSDKSVAFDKAMNYLSRSMKTVKQMRQYLRDKGFLPQAVDYVVDKLQQYKYLNDEQYAQLYAKQSATSKGQRRICMELAQKGISQQTIQQNVDIDEQSQRQSATNLANKYMKNKTPSAKTLANLQRYLLYRGFDYDTVNGVVKSFFEVE